MDGPSRISVVIPVHALDRAFHSCLDGLRKLTPLPHEVIIVIDGAPANPVEINLPCPVKVLITPSAQGPAHARNKGARSASGEILLFLDSDVVPATDVIGRVASHFQAEGSAEALVGSYDDAPQAPNFLSQYRNLLHHYVHQTASETIPSFWGACGAIRRDVFHSVGGFNDQYDRPSIEDIELGFRLRQAGYSIRMRPDIQVAHLKAWTATTMVRTDALDRALPWSLLLLEKRELPDNLNLRIKDRWCTAIAPLLVASTAYVPAWMPSVFIAITAAIVLIGLNLPVYNFFRRKRGWGFALQVLPWHLVYYLCCATGSALGVMIYSLDAIGIQPATLHRLRPRTTRL